MNAAAAVRRFQSLITYQSSDYLIPMNYSIMDGDGMPLDLIYYQSHLRMPAAMLMILLIKDLHNFNLKMSFIIIIFPFLYLWSMKKNIFNKK